MSQCADEAIAMDAYPMRRQLNSQTSVHHAFHLQPPMTLYISSRVSSLPPLPSPSTIRALTSTLASLLIGTIACVSSCLLSSSQGWLLCLLRCVSLGPSGGRRVCCSWVSLQRSQQVLRLLLRSRHVRSRRRLRLSFAVYRLIQRHLTP